MDILGKIMNNTVKKERNSNYELMRIISMLLIICGHTISWGGIEEHASAEFTNVIYIIYAILIIHVNSFILLTGYFQSKSKFHIKKVFKLFFLMWFYKGLVLILGKYLNWFDVTTYEMLWILSPFDLSSYWFIKVYIVLYLLSPFLNKAIKYIEKKDYQLLLLVMFITCSILTTVTNQEMFTNSRGYSLIHFIFMYLIGGYLRKYPLNFKILTNLKKKKVLYIEIFLICLLTNYLLYRLGNYLIITNSPIAFIGKRIVNTFMAYDNPLVIIGSIAYFQLFGLFNIKSKIINKLALPVLEIYMIHETPKFRPILYKTLGLTTNTYYTYKILPRIILIILTIYIGATMIYITRKNIFKVLKIPFKNSKLINNIKIIENKIDNNLNICKEA